MGRMNEELKEMTFSANFGKKENDISFRNRVTNNRMEKKEEKETSSVRDDERNLGSLYAFSYTHVYVETLSCQEGVAIVHSFS